jgi:hypothetical protein
VGEALGPSLHKSALFLLFLIRIRLEYLMRNSFVKFLLCVAVLGCALASHAQTGRRLAFVVGNDNYLSVEKLRNARNDAKLMANTLREARFEVSELNDLDLRRFWRELDAFQSRIKKGDEVVFFFAGHGVQIGAEQVLLPTDILAESDAQVLREGLPLTKIQDALRDARFALMVIDACRDNPFPPRGTRSIGGLRGLGTIEAAEGMAIIMSAGRGQKALDSVPGQTNSNGLFTFEFARTIRVPGVDVRTALTDIRERVEERAKRANHVQRPTLVDETSGRFYFFEATGFDRNANAASNQALSAPAPGVRVQSADEIEQEYWNAIREGKDVRDFQDYIKRYPQGRFLAAAERQVRLLSNTSPTVAAPAVTAPVAAAAAPRPSAPASAAPAAPTPATTAPASSSASRPAAVAAAASSAGPEMLVGNTRFRGVFAPDGPERKLSGEGEVRWANGDVYIGRLNQGVRVGVGEMRWSNGQSYKGTWTQDEPQGEGTLGFANGDSYSGDVRAGKPNGTGKMIFGSGDHYEGAWVLGKAHGSGIYVWKSGQRYEGNWNQDKPEGRGKLSFANGDVYEGQVFDGLPAGAGLMTYASQDVYTGQFVAGKPHGEGEYRWRSGDTYKGAWQNGLKHGKGVQAWANGDRWEGEYASDAQTANGRLIRKQ